jgi:CHAD domain-containing protein
MTDDPDTSRESSAPPRQAVAEFLRKQVRKLSGHLPGCSSGEEVESVHQARVASRRLRAVFAVYAPLLGEKRCKDWRKAIRKFTRRLGEARDLDVQIDHIETLQKELKKPTCRPGVQRVHLRLQQQRRARQGKVEKAVEKLQDSEVLGELDEAAARLAESGREGEDLTALELSERYIRSQTGRVLSWQVSLADGDDARGHHKMRIELKRLRYALEIGEDFLGAMARDGVERIKELQDLLGEMHDCDVWRERIAELEPAERERTREYFGEEGPFEELRPGFEWIARWHENRREALFGRLQQRWRSLVEAGMFIGVLRSVQDRLDRETLGDENAMGWYSAACGGSAGRAERVPEDAPHARESPADPPRIRVYGPGNRP